MSKLLIRNGILVSLEPLKLEKLDILVEDGRIVHRDERIQVDRDTRILDCRRKFIIPGLVNAHSRLYASQLANIPGNHEAVVSRNGRYESLRWQAEGALAPETIVTAVFAGALEAVRQGTTTTIDVHSSPACIGGSLDLVRDAVQTVGLRSVLSYETTDRHGSEKRDEALEENRRFAEAHGNDKISGAYGAHSSISLGDETLGALTGLIQETKAPFHVTIDEDADDREHAANEHGRSAARRLDDHGLIGPRTILAHGVHLDDEDIALLKERRSWMVHCPSSDMHAGVGSAAVDRMGELVALGSNTSSGDMFSEARMALAMSRARGTGATPEDIIKMHVGGQQLASELLGLELGSTGRDAGADFVVLNYHPRTPINEENLASHIVLSMGVQHIETVVVDGRVAYHNGRYPEIDTRKLAPLMRRGAEQLWENMGTG